MTEIAKHLEHARSVEAVCEVLPELADLAADEAANDARRVVAASKPARSRLRGLLRHGNWRVQNLAANAIGGLAMDPVARQSLLDDEDIGPVLLRDLLALARTSQAYSKVRFAPFVAHVPVCCVAGGSVTSKPVAWHPLLSASRRCPARRHDGAFMPSTCRQWP